MVQAYANAMSGGAPTTRWNIQGSFEDMDAARRFAGLDPNAVNASGELLDGVLAPRFCLSYPSFFCQSSAQWLRALSYLVLRNRGFYLTVEEVDGVNGDHLLSFAQLYPKMSGPVLEMLRAFSGESADRLDDLSDRVARAFAMLRASGGEIEEGQTPRPPSASSARGR